jgi:hypothetical protein
MISSHDGGLRLVAAPGGRASLRASSTAVLDTSPEREPCGGFVGPRARERRAEWRVGGPRARESGWLRFQWSSCRRVVGLVATALWRWVPHGGGPFGAVPPAPWFFYRRWFPLKWFSIMA